MVSLIQQTEREREEGIPNEITNESSQKEQSRWSSIPVVRGFGHDLRDGVEGDNTGRAAKGELDSCQDDVWEGE